MASGAPPSTAIPAPAATSGGDTKDSKWFMTLEQVQNSPSRRDGIPPDQELNLRQKAAYLIQEMGQKLRVSQLCINTAIVYMHRFYMYHSFTHFHRNGIAAAGLFLAAKVEEQPRKLESVIQVLHACLNFKIPEPQSVAYQEQAQDLVFNENVLLQTLGFDVAVDHPHTHVVKTCHLVKACKDLAQTSYFLASNSLHLTTMCLQYRPTVVACFCIYLACKWSRWEIPQSTEGKYWFHYVDRTVTMEILEQLTNEFLIIYENSPSRLKKQLSTYKGLGLNAKSPCPPGSRSAGQHHPGVEHSSRVQGSSSHQRSTVHHHAPKLSAHGGDHTSSKTHPPQSLPHPKSSLVSGMTSASSSGRQPSSSRPDHRANNTAEPHFSAPHRTGGSSGSSAHSSLPPLTRGNIHDPASSLPTQTTTHPPPPSQMQRLDPNAFTGSMQPQHSSSSSSNKSRHHQQQQPQQPPYQQMQPGAGQMAAPDSRPHKQQSMDLMHQKQRSSSSSSSSKDPPPKYMDPKLAAIKKIPTHSGGNNKYPEPPKPSAATHILHSNQPHLASKSSNYPIQQQQPPNYNQSMSNRSAQPQSSEIHNLSVHHHQQQQQSSQNAYNMSSESSYSNRQQQPPSDVLMHNSNLMESVVDGKLSSQAPLSTGKGPSIFSPDWSDKSMKSAPQLLDSPKMPDKRATATETTPKKDKKRESPMNSTNSQKFPASLYPVPDVKRGNSNSSSSSTTTVTATKRGSEYSGGGLIMPGVPPPIMQYDKSMYKSRPSTAVHPDEVDEESKVNVKRPHSDATAFASNVYEDPMGEYHRDSKFRKLDLESQQQQQQSHLPFGSFSTTGSLLKSNTFNGIETNPDLVSSLLKESLGEVKYSTIKIEAPPSHQIVPAPPASSLIPTPNTHHDGGANDPFKTAIVQHQPDVKPILSAAIPTYLNPLPQQPPQAHTQQTLDTYPSQLSAASAPTSSADNDADHKTKSEKKKKKDKNKHKEKDKSKDREERKKHKKDKDRSRDKESRQGDEAVNPIKIKIPKEKLNLSAADAEGSAQPPAASEFKITIPKDRLTTSAMDASAPPSGASLKIKISKGGGSAVYDVSGGMAATNAAVAQVHHHHSKKRERDRGDRSSDGKSHHDAAAVHRSGEPGSANSSNSAKDVWVNQ